MIIIELQVKRLRDSARLPAYATDGAAGMDLYADLTEDIVLEPRRGALIPTGIAIGLPSDEYAALVFARSGLAIKYGVTLRNGVGVIDSDYVGEVRIGAVNLSDSEYTVKNGDRIAQLLIVPVMRAEITETDALRDTERGAGGFGSTGR